MEAPKVSVVTVCYNAANTLDRTIQSVLSQTYENLEYIIIDGDSKDESKRIIERYSDRLYYWVSEPDKGIYDAMNKGLVVATGEWIIFMNAGDAFYSNDVVGSIIPTIKKGTDIVYGRIQKDLGDSYYIQDPLPLSEMKRLMVPFHQSTITSMRYHKQHPFDISYRSSGDYNFFYNAYYVDNCVFQYVPVIVSVFDDTEGMSKDNYKVARKEDLRIWGKDRNILSVIKMYIWFLYRDFKRFIKTNVPAYVQVYFRNLRLRRKGFIVVRK